MTTTTQPMSRRDVWLTIALAIAKGLPEPKEMTLYADRCGVSVQLESVAALNLWADHFKIPHRDRSHCNPKSGNWIHGWHSVSGEHPTGWSWQLTAYTLGREDAPEPSPLAEQVLAAIGGASCMTTKFRTPRPPQYNEERRNELAELSEAAATAEWVMGVLRTQVAAESGTPGFSRPMSRADARELAGAVLRLRPAAPRWPGA